MKKKLNTDVISNELKRGSAFFPGYSGQSSNSVTPPVGETASSKMKTQTAPSTREYPESQTETKEVSHNDIMIPRHHDTTTPRYHDTTTPQTDMDVFEIVRKAVKQIGKEAATHRFTLDEKNHLADIEYAYKRQGVTTTENQIARIAINYIIEDYRRNGELSLLDKILKKLNS